jgi:L-amino acid N-acyltransferase YncA
VDGEPERCEIRTFLHTSRHYLTGKRPGNTLTRKLQWPSPRCCKSANVPIRHAQISDLPEIVAIYNASIPGRMATADTEPVSVAARKSWFAEFDPSRRPLFVHAPSERGPVDGWLSLRSFYGRPAYHATVETGVYVAPAARRTGVGRSLLGHAVAAAPALGIRTMLAFVFAHNAASLALFERAGFRSWGLLPRVAELDRVERDVAILGLRLK